MIRYISSLTIMSYVECIPPFWDNSSAGNTESNASKKENPPKVTASQADIDLNMNCACFWVFLARVGQKNTNVQRDGSTKDNILDFPNKLRVSS